MTERGNFAEILDEYLRALEAGNPPDREALLARHPDLAEELQAVAISGSLNFSYPHCDFSYASAVCKFVVNADGTATVNSLVLQAGCFD